MKYFFCIILILYSVSSLFMAGRGDAYTIGSAPSAIVNPANKVYSPDYGAANQGVTDTSKVSVKNLIDAIGATNEATIYFQHIPGNANTDYTFSTDETFPSNITLYFEPGSRLFIDSGITVTIYSPSNIIAQPNQQIFAGEGVVLFSDPGVLYVGWFGSIGDGATDDRETIQACLDAASAGSKVIIPDTGSYYKIAATQLSDALLVDNNITVTINGELRATSHINQVDPPYIMYVTGDGAIISGSGTLRGDGSYYTAETTVDDAPGLLRVTGENVKISGLHFVNPQEIGLGLRGAHNARVENCDFTGGPLVADATDPQYYYISISNGGDGISISHCNFYMDADGGSARQGICNASAVEVYQLSITGCNFRDIHEHAIYCYVNNSICSENTIEYSQSDSDQLGGAIKFGGPYNIVSNNIINGALRGGITCYDARGCVIDHNNLYGVGHVGINITHNIAIAFGLDNNIISNNYLKSAGTGTLYEGIRYLTTSTCTSSSYGGKIINNELDGWGSASSSAWSSIRLAGPTSYDMYNFDISGNVITGSIGYGIYLENVQKSSFKNNTIYNNSKSTFRAFVTAAVDGLKFESNMVEDSQGTPTLQYFLVSASSSTNINLLNNDCFGASATDPFAHSVANNVLGRGNRISRTNNLIGTFTMNGVSSLVVSNSNILDTTLTDEISSVVITPLNSAAAQVMGSSQSLYVSAVSAGTSFTVATGDGTTVSSSSIFMYEIIQ